MLEDEAMQSGSESLGLQHATIFLSEILPPPLH